MSAFTPYEGWEDDLKAIATPIIGIDWPERRKRLLAAFDPPVCGKRIWHMTTNGLSDQVQIGGGRGQDPIRLVKLFCNLPAGHHPMTFSWRESSDHRPLCIECNRPADNSMHSPGHVPDVPEGAWQ